MKDGRTQSTNRGREEQIALEHILALIAFSLFKYLASLPNLDDNWNKTFIVISRHEL